MPSTSKRTTRRGPVSTLQEMEEALRYLMRKRMGRKYDSRRAYRMCELWSMDRPPDTLEYTPMTARIDALVGFALTEQHIFHAYDMEHLSESALYLYNIMRQELDAKMALANKKPVQLNKRASKA